MTYAVMQVINYMHLRRIRKYLTRDRAKLYIIHSLIASLIVRQLSGCFVEKINI